ncbi:MAG: lytic murein transglycosylase [Pseudomonadota bacterium]
MMKIVAAFGLAALATAIVLDARTPAMASTSIDACVDRLRVSAINAGVSRSVANEALGIVAYDERAVKFSRAQPEFKTPLWDYIAFLVDRKRIADGQRMLERHSATLDRIEETYRVDRHVVVAIWGVESDFGQVEGGFHVPHALANVICSGRRAKFFQRELNTILGLVTRGDVALADLSGSWAGAFGQTQFMPSTYKALAVDFDGDGRRDLVNSVPDALASTANFLKDAGWRDTRPWGYEVTVPSGFSGPTGRTERAEMATWRKRGLRKVDGSALPSAGSAALIRPAGKGGPSFLVTRNFDALYRYNVAISYALAIGHLADRLGGGEAFVTAWPTDDAGLSRAQRLDLQKLLIAAGYDIGDADGKIGPMTRGGIRAAEEDKGLPVTGRAGQKIYRTLGGQLSE